MNIQERLAALQIVIPKAPAPAAKCVPYVIHRDLVFVSGQVAFKDGNVMHCGMVPETVTIEEAAAAARQCALNLLAVVKEACLGDLSRLDRCIRLDGYVCSTSKFHQQPAVMDAASDLLIEILGESGRHARTAVGVNALPLNASVEINGVFAVRQ